MGNWHWTGECPQQAAHALAAQVRYVHCKGVQRQAQRWVAVPLAESSAPWRAILRSMPLSVPWAIEYPLIGDDLLATTRHEIDALRSVTESLARPLALAARAAAGERVRARRKAEHLDDRVNMARDGGGAPSAPR